MLLAGGMLNNALGDAATRRPALARLDPGALTDRLEARELVLGASGVGAGREAGLAEEVLDVRGVVAAGEVLEGRVHGPPLLEFGPVAESGVEVLGLVDDELVVAEEAGRAAGAAVEDELDGAGVCERVELGGEVGEDEAERRVGKRGRRRKAALEAERDALEVVRRRSRAPGRRGGGGVELAHCTGGGAAERGEEEAGLLAGEPRAEAVAHVAALETVEHVRVEKSTNFGNSTQIQRQTRRSGLWRAGQRCTLLQLR